jgi:hypothetical protein
MMWVGVLARMNVRVCVCVWVGRKKYFLDDVRSCMG